MGAYMSILTGQAKEIQQVPEYHSRLKSEIFYLLIYRFTLIRVSLRKNMYHGHPTLMVPFPRTNQSRVVFNSNENSTCLTETSSFPFQDAVSHFILLCILHIPPIRFGLVR